MEADRLHGWRGSADTRPWGGLKTGKTLANHTGLAEMVAQWLARKWFWILLLAVLNRFQRDGGSAVSGDKEIERSKSKPLKVSRTLFWQSEDKEQADKTPIYCVVRQLFRVRFLIPIRDEFRHSRGGNLMVGV